MIHQSIEQDLDLWEAWIEFDPESPNCFGTLYLHGEVVAGRKDIHPCMIKAGVDTQEQLIVIVQATTSGHPTRMAEVIYSEPLQYIDQYSGILIYQDNELIAQIENLEVLI